MTQRDTTGIDTYRAIAEELSSPDATMADIDPEAIEVARAWAKRNKQRWPPRPRNSGMQMYIGSIKID